MRTTLEIDEKLVREIIKVSRAKTMKSAIVIALTEYLKSKQRQELKNMIGAYDTFDLSLKDLEKMRDEE